MSSTKSVCVVIPSRSQARQGQFLARALASIAGQQLEQPVAFRVVIGVDAGASLPAGLDLASLPFPVQVVASPGQGQAAALNSAAAAAGDADYIAFLEDDDEWLPTFVQTALVALNHGGFVSSTQLECFEAGEVRRINDFPTPSGWLMPVATWQTVGPFDASYRWHLDNDWLGRLDRASIKRLHLIEATAPVQFDLMMQVRPWLAAIVRQARSPDVVGFLRHSSPWPLVRRLVHVGSGMARMQNDHAALDQSRAERERLKKDYGRIPW